MADISPYKIKFKSTFPLLDYTTQSIKLFQKVLIHDSIFNFFPYAEILIDDPTGLVADQINFSEGEEFKLDIEIDDRPDKTLNSTWVWSEFQMNDIELREHISGIDNFILISSYFKKDIKKSVYYTKLKISDIVRKILLDDYGLVDQTKIFISDTVGTYDWHRFNETSSSFIKKLANAANSATQDPFFTFFNSKGEFYFSTLTDLMASKLLPNIGEYYLSFQEDSQYDVNSIQDYSIAFGGMPVNKENYNFDTYYTTSLGVELQTTNLLTGKFKGSRQGGTSRFLIDKSNLVDTQDSVYLGILNNPTDVPFFKGRIDNLYKDTALSIRLPVTIYYNENGVSGKVIKLSIDSSYDLKGKLKEYSGKWLVTDSKITLDDGDIIWCNLELSRPTLNVDALNPKLKSFIP